MVKVERTFAVTPQGVGKRDHSRNIHLSTSKEVKTPQEPFYYVFHLHNPVTPPAWPLPQTWEEAINFTAGVVEAPARPYLFHLITEKISRNVLIAIQLHRYASLSDYIDGIIAETYGLTYGYQRTQLKYTRGIPTIEGNVYSFFMSWWTHLENYIELALAAFIGGRETL